MSSSASWGLNSCFGIYLSFYLSNDYFKGATRIQFAFVGGLSVSIAMLMAPFSNYLSKRYNFKIPLIVGTVLLVLGQILAGFSTQIWQRAICRSC